MRVSKKIRVLVVGDSLIFREVIARGLNSDPHIEVVAMRRKGARTIGQDEESSAFYGMPKVAIEVGAVEKQVPLSAVPQTLLGMLRLES